MSRTGIAVAVLAVVMGACSSGSSEGCPAEPPRYSNACTNQGLLCYYGSCPLYCQCVNGGGCAWTETGCVDAGPMVDAPAPICTSSMVCMPGQICCENGSLMYPYPLSWSAKCQAGPCQANDAQLCATSAECVTAGDVCGWDVAAGAMACAPGDSGTDTSVEEGSVPDGSDSGTPDAPAGG